MKENKLRNFSEVSERNEPTVSMKILVELLVFDLFRQFNAGYWSNFMIFQFWILQLLTQMRSFFRQMKADWLEQEKEYHFITINFASNSFYYFWKIE